MATSLALATLFFAGAALSAGAGDTTVEAESTEAASAAAACNSTSADAEAAADPGCSNDAEPTASGDETEPAESGDESAGEQDAGGDAPADEAPAEEAPAETDATQGEGSEDAASQEEPTNERTSETPPADDASGTPTDDDSAGGGAGTAPAAPRGNSGGNDQAARPAGPPLDDARERQDETGALDPEAHTFGAVATVWLHRRLPDPTPPARRLAPAFARMLQIESARAGADWAMVLAVVRANGELGRTPATTVQVRRIAGRLHELKQGRDEWQTFAALHARTGFADSALAITRYNRAVGLGALVLGLEAAKRQLENRVLADERLAIYPGGRSDIEAGRIDVRVLVLMRYLAEAHGSATVSSLETGHRLYARPGVISAHVYGLAVDIAALGGKPVLGNSSPGALTERAVRNILLLPAELRPRQVISLLGLGGPSFPLANHADHIHVGF